MQRVELRILVVGSQWFQDACSTIGLVKLSSSTYGAVALIKAHDIISFTDWLT